MLNNNYNHYPFGSVTPGRSFTSGSYRYGFNGKEKDNETYGSNNAYDFGARIYDDRLGRWLCLDPLQIKYPETSPFGFSANSPIMFKDEDGKVVVDPKTDLPVVKVNGAWKTITGKGSDNMPIYGDVSEAFVKNTQPVLDKLTATKTGTKIYDNLQSISTIVVIDLSDKTNKKGAEKKGGTPSEWHTPGDKMETGTDGLYKKVIISPQLDNINASAAKNGVDADEKFLQVMSVEAGHINSKEQIAKEKSYDYNFDTPEKFADVYNPLLNQAIKVGKELRTEQGKPIDETSKQPITNPQKAPIGAKLTLDEKNK